MKLHHLAAFGVAWVAATTSTTSWAQDPPPARSDVGPTDHSLFVGDFAIGYMGFQTLSIANGTGDFTEVSAPVIGGRYWLDSFMGIDAGIGFNFAGQSSTTEMGDTTTDTDEPQPTAFVLHGGLPLALADSRYFVFQVVPELNIGFAGNTVDDVELRGFHLDIGARAGAEVHFGFIDIPQLSLQAGVGVSIRYDRVSASDEDADVTISSSRTFFGTTVGNNPWDIFTSSISALYYFDR